MGIWDNVRGLLAKKRPAEAPKNLLPASSVPRDIPLSKLAEWADVERVRATISEFEVGQFVNAAQLAEAMMRDDRIAGLMDQRIKSLLGQGMSFQPEGADDEVAETDETEAIAWCEENFSKMAGPAALTELALWGHLLGVGLGELTWDTSGETWAPSLRVWHPRHLLWRWDTRKFYVNTMDGQEEINPGDGRWVLYCPNGVQRGWLRGLLRRLAIPWLIRQFAYRDWARYSEVHGIPTRIAKVPAGATPDDTRRFLREITNLSTESVILAKQTSGDTGYDVSLVEAAALGWEGFNGLIEKAEDSIAITILGQTLTSGAKSGGLGTGGVALVHERVRADLLDFDSKTLGDCIRDQIIKPAMALNFGESEDCPCPHWELEPPEDLGGAATALNTAAQALANLQTARVPVDVEKFAAKFDIPLREGADPNAVAEEMDDMAAEAAKVGLEGQKKAAAGADSADRPSPDEELSRAALSTKPDGFIKGQIYTDDLADDAATHGSKALAPNIGAILAIVQEAKSYEELRAHIISAFRGMDPHRLAEVLRKAIILADLNGRDAVIEDG